MSAPARQATLHRPAGSLSGGGFDVLLTPEIAGWSHAGLRVASIAAGERLELRTGADEHAVLPLSGSIEVHVEGRAIALAGRRSVFDRVTDWAYLPIDCDAELITREGCEVALASARATRRLDSAHVPASAVPVEVRGAGPATRQVNNFMAPGVFDGAERLMCVEVLTPDGNWSSYPPHRHDDSPECAVNNEEIYYFRIGRAEVSVPSNGGFAVHRTYTPDASIDETVVIRDGDVFLIPRGYHGPSIAAPGYPLYYLNVLAGIRPERSLAFCDDPAHAWVRDSWRTMPPDPRVPMTTAAGRARP